MNNFVGGPTYCSTKFIEDLEPVVLADLFCPKRHEGEYASTSISTLHHLATIYTHSIAGDVLICRVITTSTLAAGITL
jgi:hypothetical protein